MSYCDCACSRELSELKQDIRYLKSDIDQLKGDLRRESEDRRDHVRGVANDLSDHEMGHT